MLLGLFSREAEAALVRLIDERVAEQLAAVSPTPAKSPLVTVKEAAELVRTSPGAIYKRIKRGQLVSFRPEGSPILLYRDHLWEAGPQTSAVL